MSTKNSDRKGHPKSKPNKNVNTCKSAPGTLRRASPEPKKEREANDEDHWRGGWDIDVRGGKSAIEEGHGTIAAAEVTSAGEDFRSWLVRNGEKLSRKANYRTHDLSGEVAEVIVSGIAAVQFGAFCGLNWQDVNPHLMEKLDKLPEWPPRVRKEWRKWVRR